MSGWFDAEEDVRLGMIPLKLLHPLNQLFEPGTSIAEYAVFSELNPPKINGSGHMSFFGNVCADDQGVFRNSRNSLILFL
ncbi:hypothetical protein D3C78_1466330 [compost metagenome]